MKLEELALIEKELCLSLPESYKRAALEAKIAATRHPSRFFDDPNKVISTNRRLREKGIYGQPWQINHFAFGYQKDGGEYYFIDINHENGYVYLANKTKMWRYCPEEICNNKSPYDTINYYVEFMCDLNEMVAKSENRPPQLKLSEEENKAKIANFFSELWKDNQ
jgi:hypothetical protein